MWDEGVTYYIKTTITDKSIFPRPSGLLYNIEIKDYKVFLRGIGEYKIFYF